MAGYRDSQGLMFGPLNATEGVPYEHAESCNMGYQRHGTLAAGVTRRRSCPLEHRNDKSFPEGANTRHGTD